VGRPLSCHHETTLRDKKTAILRVGFLTNP
jgi:hypothetical protein